MVSIPFQELKANGDGSFNGGVQRKTESRQDTRKAFPTHTGQRDTEVWAAVLREMCCLSTKKAAPRTGSPPLSITY